MFKCSVPDCLSHLNTSTLVSLHKYYTEFSFNFLLNYWYVKLSSRFPCKIKDPLRHGEWSKFCSPTYISNTRSRLCDLHFSFSQFKFHQVVGSKTRNVLKTTAVPDVALYVVADTGTDNFSGTVTATAIDTAKNFVTKEVMCYLKIVNLKSEVSTKKIYLGFSRSQWSTLSIRSQRVCFRCRNSSSCSDHHPFISNLGKPTAFWLRERDYKT